MAFDPDAYLRRISPQGFDPDKYLSGIGIAQKPEEEKKPSGFLGRLLEAAKPEPFTREVLDVPLKIARGTAGTTRAISESFGANNEFTQSVKGVEDYLARLASAQSRQDSDEIGLIMKEAEDKGAGDQLKAALKAFSVAPIDFLAQAAGSTVPILLGAVAGPAGVIGTAALAGAGTVKGTIYDTVKEELKAAGVSEKEAEARAQLAQEYGGENLDLILGGTVLGVVAGRTGVERYILGKVAAKQVAQQAAQKGVVRQALETGATEAIPEAVQAGQEQLAANIALQREGLDVPTFRGVAGQAALEGIAGGALGAGIGAAGAAGPAAAPPGTTPAATPAATPATPAAAPPAAAVPVQPTPSGPVTPVPPSAGVLGGYNNAQDNTQTLITRTPDNRFQVTTIDTATGQSMNSGIFDTVEEADAVAGQIVGFTPPPAPVPTPPTATPTGVTPPGVAPATPPTVTPTTPPVTPTPVTPTGVAPTGVTPTGVTPPITPTPTGVTPTIKPPEFTPEEQQAIQNYFVGDIPNANTIFQNRDRSGKGLIAQMQRIAAKPNYSLVGPSKVLAEGAPVVISDINIPNKSLLGRVDTATASNGQRFPVQYAVVPAADLIASNTADGSVNPLYGNMTTPGIRVVAGNGRVAGIQEAYRRKTAGQYATEMMSDPSHGVDFQEILNILDPVLVRIMPKSLVPANIGDLSNVPGVARLEPVDRAKNDLQRLSGKFDLTGLQFTEEGMPQLTTIKQFIQAMPESEQSELINKSTGQPTPEAFTRLMNAIFYGAYENDALIDLYAATTNPDAKMYLNSLAKVAPKMVKLTGTGDYDIRPRIVEAIENMVSAVRQGVPIKEMPTFVKQGAIGLDPYAQRVMEFIADSGRSSKRIAEGLSRLADSALAASQISQEPDMFGQVPPRPTLDNVFEALRAVEAEPDLFGEPPPTPTPTPAPTPTPTPTPTPAPTPTPTPEPKVTPPATPKATPPTQPKEVKFDIDKTSPEIYQEIKNLNMLGLSQWAIDNAPNEVARAMAEKIKDRINDFASRGIKIQGPVILNDSRRVKSYAGQLSTRASARGVEFVYKLNGLENGKTAKFQNGLKYETILHELVHLGTTVQTMGLPKTDPLIKELEALRAEIRAKFIKDLRSGKFDEVRDEKELFAIRYALKNKDELMAKGLTNEYVEKYFKEVQVSKNFTAFGKLVDIARRMLGLPQNTTSALEALLSVTDKLLSRSLIELDKDVAGRVNIVKRRSVDAKETIPEERRQDELGKTLSESQFYRQYMQHIDIRGRREGTAEQTRDKILQDGFKRAIGVNAFTPYRGGEPQTVVERRLMPKKNDIVYLAPKGAWVDTPNGAVIQDGWKPKPWEVIKVFEDGPSMYQEYLKARQKYAEIPQITEDEASLIPGLSREEKIAEYAALRARRERLVRGVIEGGATVDLQRSLTQIDEMSKALRSEIAAEYVPNMSPENFLRRALEAFDKGDLNVDVLSTIQATYNKTPWLLNGLRLSVRTPKQPDRSSGNFDPFDRIVTLWNGTSGVEDPAVVRHEIMHSLEQMMTSNQRNVLIESWQDALKKAVKANPDQPSQEYFSKVLAFLDSPSDASFAAAVQAMPSYDFYQYLNPSEYWAINAEKLMASKLGIGWDRFVKAVRKLFEGLKSVFGFNNNYGVHKVFDQLMRDKPTPMNRMSLTAFLAVTGARPVSLNNIATNIFGQPIPKGTWGSPNDTKMDNVIYLLQDKHIDTKRVVQNIKAAGKNIADRWDPYLQEELFHGRTAKQTQDFLKNELEPLMVDMRNRGLTMAQVEEYLHNRHAETRNKFNAKRDPKMPDGGSGILTADAQKYLAALTPQQKADFDAIAKRIDYMVAATQQIIVDTGQETQQTIDAWNKALPDYVPLQREEVDYDVKNVGIGVGSGIAVKGPFSRAAVGSSKQVVDILANLAMQRERAIVRGEKMRVSKALYGLVASNPNPTFWLAFDPEAVKDPAKAAAELGSLGLNPSDIQNIIDEPVIRRIDPVTNQVVERPNALLVNSRTAIPVRINGKEKYVIFNAKDPRAERMAEALKNLDADQLGKVMGGIQQFTQFFARINTQYNPVFGVINFLRDTQAALIQVSNTPLKGNRTKILGGVPGALRGIYAEERARRAGKPPVANTWSQLWEEFQQEGGQTGFRDQFSRQQERADALQAILDPSSWTKSPLGKVFTAGGTLKVPMEIARKTAAPLFNWLSDYNQTMENAIRLSAYKAALDKGMTKQQAASLAKNLTVNFNRKGQIGRQAGALYAFFNASVQGAARMGGTMFQYDGKGYKLSTIGKTVIGGGLVLGVAQAMVLAAMGFDEDEPPDFIKERNFIIPRGEGKYFTIPMPLGYNVIPNTSRILTEWMLSGFKNTPKRVVDLTGAFVDMFNPLGNAGWSFQTFAPTVADPIVALGENVDWTGKPIAKKDISSLDPTPGYTRAKETASVMSKELAYYLNLASGGTDYKPGVISPTPDQIDYLVGQLTGGVGRELLKAEQTITSRFTGEDLPMYKVPLVGRFMGETTGIAAERTRFYNNLTELNKHENEIKGRIKDKVPTRDYFLEYPEARLYSYANQVERNIQTLKKRRDMLIDKGASKEQVKAVENQMLVQMKRFNDRVKTAQQ